MGRIPRECDSCQRISLPRNLQVWILFCVNRSTVFALLGQDRYAEADPLYRRAQAIREKLLGTEHIDVAHVIIDRALSLHQQVRSNENTWVFYSLGGVSLPKSFHRDMGKVTRWILRCLCSYEKFEYSILDVSRSYITPCPCVNQGDFARAEPLYVRATEITENALGPDHHEVAAVLKDRADMYVIQVRERCS